ncbi:MAG: superinfection immunity protein [Bacteroidales bacterium]|jgi:hypothetical protein|nr:superinfection immunity protein [Bacteroidales bacterium]
MDNAIIIILIILIYFIPSFIGWNTKNASGILILNIFLGWTFLGWVGALIWAVSAPKVNINQNYLGKKQNTYKLQKQLVALKDVIFMNTGTNQNINEEVNQLLSKLKKDEAIVKCKLTNKYDIISAEQWDKILKENRQDEYEIIEEN